MEISMCTNGTGISMMDLDDFINYSSSCMNGLINSKHFRIIASPNQLMVDDIAEIKVFPGNRAMMVTIKTTKKEEKKYHTIKKDRYEVGDLVLVKKWNDMVAEYGLDSDGDINTRESFTRDMKKYCGNIMTVSLVDEDGTYKLKDAGFWFSNDMIEGAVQE